MRIAALPLAGILHALVRRRQADAPDAIVGGCLCKGRLTCGHENFSTGRICSKLLLHHFECDLIQVLLPKLLIETLHTTAQLLHSRWVICSLSVLPDVSVAH